MMNYFVFYEVYTKEECDYQMKNSTNVQFDTIPIVFGYIQVNKIDERQEILEITFNNDPSNS